MSMRSKWISLVFVLVVAISIALAPRVATAAIGDEIVINGGFETGDLWPWEPSNPWTMAVRDNGPPPHSGTYTCLMYGGNDVSMWQNITGAQADLLNPNTTYRYSAWYYAEGGGHPTEPGLKVNLNGINDIVDVWVTSPVYGSWQEITGEFTTGPEAITIGQIMLRQRWPSGSQYKDWDDVSLMEIPEPATLGLLSFAGLVLVRKRRA